jgi:hypothetical protein
LIHTFQILECLRRCWCSKIINIQFSNSKHQQPVPG